MILMIALYFAEDLKILYRILKVPLAMIKISLGAKYIWKKISYRKLGLCSKEEIRKKQRKSGIHIFLLDNFWKFWISKVSEMLTECLWWVQQFRWFSIKMSGNSRLYKSKKRTVSEKINLLSFSFCFGHDLIFCAAKYHSAASSCFMK